MKKSLLMLVLLSSCSFTPALAQAPEAGTQPTSFTITVTQQELQIIGGALEDLPFKKSAPLMNKLNQQIQNQVNPPKPPLSANKPEAEKKE